MIQLNLPKAKLRGKKQDDKPYVWDMFRSKYVRLTPEEWVRQHFAHYMVNHLEYPASLMVIEYATKVNGLDRRSDIVVFNNKRTPVLAVECKAPSVKITQDVFNQIANYNLDLNVDYLVVTNGLNHYCCKLDRKNHRYDFIEMIPPYSNFRC
ncbi:type I restriction enzyme HsdR N-terminal domain-containing protein [Halosquirtibacter xylanolyticus]|uniref:type I restriction enzyme HsdR N-terminal domain-containing protein n=1 Tax=Halosquirtibacter xylanolyticus TaxID=3374599 RepID=UPI003747EDE0|nr:type I restriction enzyme HsdR N-terminal domain-containing protein [Prolixibacteraceae bacterium]